MSGIMKRSCLGESFIMVVLFVLSNNLLKASEVTTLELCDQKATIIGRLGIPVGGLVEARVSVAEHGLLIHRLSDEIVFDTKPKTNEVHYLERIDGEFRVRSKDLRELDEKTFLVFETFGSSIYPNRGFFQHGDFIIPSSGKQIRSNVFILKKGDFDGPIISEPMQGIREIRLKEVKEESVKIVGRFGQSLEETLVGSVKFQCQGNGKVTVAIDVPGKDKVTVDINVDKSKHKSHFSDCEFYRTNVLAEITAPITEELLMKHSELEQVRLFERLVMIGVPQALIDSSREKTEKAEKIRFRSQLVLRLEF